MGTFRDNLNKQIKKLEQPVTIQELEHRMTQLKNLVQCFGSHISMKKKEELRAIYRKLQAQKKALDITPNL